MYASHLSFHTWQVAQVEQELLNSLAMAVGLVEYSPRKRFTRTWPLLVRRRRGLRAGSCRFRDTHHQITQVTEREEVQKWSSHMSGLLTQSPKREVYLIVE